MQEEARPRALTEATISLTVQAPGEMSTNSVILLCSLVASGQIRLRRIDGWPKVAGVLSQRTRVAA